MPYNIQICMTEIYFIFQRKTLKNRYITPAIEAKG